MARFILTIDDVADAFDVSRFLGELAARLEPLRVWPKRRAGHIKSRRDARKTIGRWKVEV